MLRFTGSQRVGHDRTTELTEDVRKSSLVAQTEKNLLTMQESWLRSLGQEDPLEEGMATHSSVLAWRIPWTEGPGRLLPVGSQRIGYN